MKKLLSLVLTLTVVLSLGACTSSESTKETSSKTESSQPAENKDEKPAQSEDKTEDIEAVPFEEIVVIDNDACAIKITGIEEDNFWGYTVNAYMENKSADKTYMFSVESAAINGVSCDPLFANEGAAGKKSNDDINFMDSELEENDIGKFTDIEITFRVYDSDDWTADDIANETVHIYPYGEDKATTFVRETLDTDNVVIDNDYVTVIVTGYENDDIWGYTANLFLVNKTTDTNLMYNVDEASINGFMADPFFATTVPAGKCSFASMSWSVDTLAENNITNIQTIELLLSISDSDDWLADDIVNETITLNP